MKDLQLNEFGLREKEMGLLLALFADFPEIEQVILYGSRAMGTYEMGSDVDLAIVGDAVSNKTISIISNQIENESPILLHFDILAYSSIKNEELKKRIDTYGKLIYSK